VQGEVYWQVAAVMAGATAGDWLGLAVAAAVVIALVSPDAALCL